MSGYDIDLIQRVTKYVSIPVIASGGAGSYQHLCDAVLVGGASAVAAASMFHFTEQTPGEAKEFMQRNGIPVRLSTVRGGGDKRLPEAAYHQKTWLAGKGDQH
jgi:cyclase